jgi:hypothetical protein
MRFLILGPLEAYDRERRLSLGGAKQRGLLAMLLLHANEVVSSDRLVDALWGDAASEDAAKALSVAVSRLRKVLEPERSPGAAGELRPPGYLLRLEDDQLDLHRFERLVVRRVCCARPWRCGAAHLSPTWATSRSAKQRSPVSRGRVWPPSSRGSTPT